jgi:hypothetical protein
MIPDATYENWYAQTGRIYGCKATRKAKPGGGPHRNRERRQGPCTSSPSQGAVISWDLTTGAAIKRKTLQKKNSPRLRALGWRKMNGDVRDDGNRELGWSGRIFLSMWSGGLDLCGPSEDPRATARHAAEIHSLSRSAPRWPTAVGFVKCSGSCGDRNRSPEARKSRISPRGESRRGKKTKMSGNSSCA